MNQNKDEKPKWYYKSNINSIGENKVDAIWNEYSESEMIENSYQNFISTFEENTSIYPLENSNFLIDFTNNLQINKSEPNEKSPIGRFYGDPSIKDNLFDNKNYIFFYKNLFQRQNLSFMFSTKQSFIDYIYLDFIFQLNDKNNLSSLGQAKNDLIKFSKEYIIKFEKDNTSQLEQLEEFVIEIKNDNIVANAIKWLTRDCFIFRMINNALQKEEFIDIFNIRYYIYLLRKQLLTQSTANHTRKLYMVSKLPTKEILKMKESIAVPFLIKGFSFSCDNMKNAINHLKNLKTDEDNSVILLEIEAEDNEIYKYCPIRFSKANTENEYLINTNILLKSSKFESIKGEIGNYEFIQVKFADLSSLKSKISGTTWEFKGKFNSILDKNYNLDSFYLAEIFDLLNKGTKLFELFSEFSSQDPLEISTVLYYKGKGSVIKGQFDKALEFYFKSLEIKESILGSNSPIIANVLSKIGFVYGIKGEADKVLEYLLRSQKIYESTIGSNHPDTATTLNSIGLAYGMKGDLEKCLESHLKSLKIYETTLGSNSHETASTLNNIGLAFKNKGEIDKALEYFKKSLMIFESTLGLNHSSTAMCLNCIGLAYQTKGEYSKALDFYKRTLEINHLILGLKHPETANTYNNIALTYQNLGDYDKASVFYLKALKIYQLTLGMNHPETATTLNNIGSVYDSKGEYDKAVEFYLKSLKIKESILGPTHPDTVSTLNNLGSTYDNKGIFDKALEYYFKVLNIYYSTIGLNHASTANILNKIGIAYDNKKDSNTSLEFFFKSLKISETILPPNHPDTASTLYNIGLAFDNIGQCDKALEYYFRSLDIRQINFGSNHPETATTLNNIASAFKTKGDFEKALEFYNKVLVILKSSAGPDHPSTKAALKDIESLKNKEK